MKRREFIAGGLAAGALRADWLQSEAPQKLYNLDYTGAIAAFERECKTDTAGDAHNDLASALLYWTLFKADALDGAVALGVSDYLHKPKVKLEPEDRARFQKATAKGEELARARLAKNSNDAAALYTLGESFTNRANLALLAEKEWRVALKMGGEARKLHARALELDKTLIDALLVPSVHEYIVGSLPMYMRALGFMVGLTGDKEKGMAGLRTVAASGVRTKLEAQVLISLVERREDRPERALPIMKGLEKQYPTNHLYRREVTNLLVDMNKMDEAKNEFAQLGDPRYKFLRPDRLEIYKRHFQARLRA